MSGEGLVPVTSKKPISPSLHSAPADRVEDSPRTSTRLVRTALVATYQHAIMSLLPGLGLTEPEEAAKIETSQHHLVKESEWRFEVAADKSIQVKVSTVHWSHG